MPRAALLILDSLGVGALPDAAAFGDVGANTLGHIAAHTLRTQQRPLQVPHLQRLGLGHAARLASGHTPAGFDPDINAIAAWGAARERSTGKDTTSGHWEMMGVPMLDDWGYFRERENSMPAALLDAIAARTDLPGWLGNCHASGTTIIAELGEEHVRSGKPIVYTSADSVLQIACHESAFGLERLYRLCAIARECVDDYRIGRVIARPFVGDDAASFKRSHNRHDYSTPPPSPTLLDRLCADGGAVHGIGKIPDIFAHSGISTEVKAHGIDGLFDATLATLAQCGERGLVFTNFVDFDSEYGHRRDVAGYAAALEYFDTRMPELLAALQPDDLLILSADHGNDPTWPGSDHTREHIPILACGAGLRAGSIGIRDSFADIGQSLATHLRVAPLDNGTSFLQHTRPEPA
ncbi:MAG: phosphopentomutase [Xanthomonadaceae bacterium]|nr:phosphopentomutase [Xanthomonadaceae bacterium]MDP2184604.1 phosphopentomutase [Xanthomonadales bacterium]MDZ4115559.1 phosphopentomutase [Xanthomonadaceae bacterium]MDZ4379620.1 phosphopentomutase [Xanthomonadaceae bacterium]